MAPSSRRIAAWLGLVVCFGLVAWLGFSVSVVARAAAAPRADDEVRKETRVDEARARFGVTGEGVIIAILDRGIDYEHPDFRNEDGTSRILYILDLTDDTGANDPANTAGVGTLYPREAIDAALASGQRLATRDAVGHGTTTAGLAGGNGRASSGLYAGMAPEASFIIVKFTTEGAPAHDGEPAEDSFFEPSLLPVALDFVLEKADEVDMPVVTLANFGSIGALPDGTTDFARTVDERFGPGKPGRVFVTGTSDDGGMPNHASATIGAGEALDLRIRKGHDGNLRLRLWYDGADRFDTEVVTPSGTFGPYAAPATNTGRADEQTTAFRYYHNGSEADFAQATSDTREILIDFTGPTGEYVVRLTGASVTDGRFHAWLNPSRIGAFPDNRFESFAEPGYTVHHGAAALHNIAPNSYVLRHEWTDVNGSLHVVSDQGAIGDLWDGSGVGPTVDGRFGVTVSAPGERLFAPYAPRSRFATVRGNVVFDDGAGGLYGLQSAVSAASPVVTGIIALMLQADPTLDAAEVKSILQETARQDAFTGTVPNNEWGYGKVDAFGAVAVASGTGVAREDDPALPSDVVLERNYPNPFNPATTIRFSLSHAGPVRLAVYDVLGREVDVLVDRPMGAGSHEVRFDASGLPSGTYFYRVKTARGTRTQMMSLVR